MKFDEMQDKHLQDMKSSLPPMKLVGGNHGLTLVPKTNEQHLQSPLQFLAIGRLRLY